MRALLYMDFGEHVCAFLWDVCLGVELLGCKMCSALGDPAQTFCEWWYLCTYQKSRECRVFPYPCHPKLFIPVFLITAAVVGAITIVLRSDKGVP